MLHFFRSTISPIEEEKVEEEPIVEEIVYETDPTKIAEYNKWHMEFYGRPSPYIPSGPPLPLPPPPNHATALSIAAKYVAMNGGDSQQKLIDHNGDSCEFLQYSSAYYTYYQMRVRQILWDMHQQYAHSNYVSL